MMLPSIQRPSYLGIDVSKKMLDVYFPTTQCAQRFQNNETGFAQLAALLSKTPNRMVMEATGGLERPAHRWFSERGHLVSIVNPRSVRRLAQGIGKLAKTDKLDAEILSRYGEVVEPIVTGVRSAHQQELSDYVTRRRQLVHMLTQEKNRLSRASLTLAEEIELNVEHLNTRIKVLDKKIKALVAQDETNQRNKTLLMSVPGVGEVVATLFVTELPELGQVDDRKIASLVGVAPFNCDSGTLKGKRMIWGGRMHIRRGLYIATLVATQCNPVIQAYYKKLCEKGKPKKVALVACMRKLLIILNHMIAKQEEWRPNEKNN